ncbi:glutathionylspermidine synthase family protein [Candidatus Bathyarchaeota archaeon]|nr:glutathionylspermidine synthase family protein [Candidatus Bathyarchaeota archaeon]
MRRIIVEPRPNATRLVQSQGLVYSTSESTDSESGKAKNIYWPDDRYYSFTSEETELVAKAGRDVWDMCEEAAEYILEEAPEMITEKMGVPAFAVEQIKKSWDREPSWGSVYGRFDVCFGGLDHPDPRLRTPKFYEFNADTPTSLVEAGVIQWRWLEQTGHGNDQYNLITEMLVTAWERNLAEIEKVLGHRPTIFFASAEDEPSGEDAMNTALMMDLAMDAGWKAKMITVEEIAFCEEDGRFYTPRGEHLTVVFKLYPWEFMVNQPFGKAAFKDMERIGERDEEGKYVGGTVWIEAPFKMLWSNKAIFAILWQLFKDDPRSKWLLPTYFEDEKPEELTKYAKKPIFAREGADIILHKDGKDIQDTTTGDYGKEGYIVQELAILPEFEDEEGTLHYPVIGLWWVDGEAAGIGIREDRSPITTNGSTFVPHSISDAEVNYEREPVPSLEEIEKTIKGEEYADAEVIYGRDPVPGREEFEKTIRLEYADEVSYEKKPVQGLGEVEKRMVGEESADEKDEARNDLLNYIALVTR